MQRRVRRSWRAWYAFPALLLAHRSRGRLRGQAIPAAAIITSSTLETGCRIARLPAPSHLRSDITPRCGVSEGPGPRIQTRRSEPFLQGSAAKKMIYDVQPTAGDIIFAGSVRIAHAARGVGLLRLGHGLRSAGHRSTDVPFPKTFPLKAAASSASDRPAAVRIAPDGP